MAANIMKALVLLALRGQSFRLLSRGGARVARAHYDPYAMYDGQMLIEFQPNHNTSGTAAGLQDGKALLELQQSTTRVMTQKLKDLDCVNLGEHGLSHAICDRAATETLKSLFSEQVKVLHEDAGGLMREENAPAKKKTKANGGSDTFYTKWRTLRKREKRVRKLVKEAAEAGLQVTRDMIGWSYEGRQIWVVRIRGEGWKKGMPRFVHTYQLHGREWITGMVGVYVVEESLKKAKKDPKWLRGVELAIVFCANPDGTHWTETRNRVWRKNRNPNGGAIQKCRGVDLNRNFQPAWGKNDSVTDKCDELYIGTEAFSEPEAKAIKKLIDEGQVSLHWDVHSYGQVILLPFSYKWEIPPGAKEVGNIITKAMKKNNRSYPNGGNELLGPASGVCPDYASSKGGYGITFEIRPSNEEEKKPLEWWFKLPANQILPCAEEVFEAVIATVPWVRNHTKPWKGLECV